MTFDAKEKSTASGAPIECFKFTSGGTTWRYTSSDDKTTLPTGAAGANEDYVPDVVTRSEMEYSDEDAGGAIEITVVRWSPIAALYIPFTPTSAVGITVYRVHQGETDYVVAFSGRVVSASFEGSEVKLTCSPTSAVLKRTLPRVSFQSQCNWALYSVPCGVNKASFSLAATISNITGGGVTLTATNFGAVADGYWTAGWIERSNGERRFIVDHVGTVVTIMSPFFGLLIGENVTVYAGCDRTEAACRLKFGNIVNHLGFSRIPTRNVHEKGLG